jgi:hypothetical protein|tara:strand:+ start:297 stop:848 length:552 start_codon:yes stop_codon:yes gene_type:complete
MIPRKNKRGDFTALFVFMIIAFALSILVVVMYYVGTETFNQLLTNQEGIQKALEGTGLNATDVITDTFGQVPNAYQSLKWITTMLIVGMMLSILISSFMVRTRPVFLVAYVLIWIIAIIVSVPLSNVYDTVYQNDLLASSFAGFWGQTYIFLNLPLWITVIGGLAGILMFVNMVRGERYNEYA